MNSTNVNNNVNSKRLGKWDNEEIKLYHILK